MPTMSLSDPSNPQTYTTPCHLCPNDFSESLQVPIEPTLAVLVPSAQHPPTVQPPAPSAGFAPSTPVLNGSFKLNSLPFHPMITRAKAGVFQPQSSGLSQPPYLWLPENSPNQRAVSVSGKFDLTHARLHQLIEKAASRLAAAGVKAGDVVALTFPNTVEFIIMFLAVIRVRATAAPLNSAYTSDEFEFYLSDTESKILLTSKEGNQPAQAAASKLKIPHCHIHAV
ncbi:hypothetical protein F0562_031241 [Nyssa sinensis]|uniref:AMP-dependent synthetase/ligase domain-containing protein n=1 Tax=Nyssa sinensis TaxID=561372 RepID=A0A5J5ATY1_9ASTE|nr:hypothetical protein F0562_031241 [Nyssa sinensis]